MIVILQLFSLLVIICRTGAYDILEGFIQQGLPCFELIHDEGCNLTLSQVYSPPFKGSNINKMDTKLWLFTVKNPEKAEPLHRCGGKLPEHSDFDPNVHTVVMAHGWLDGVCRTAWQREIKEQLFQRGKYNVILVDWTWGNTFDLIDASVNSLVAGEDIAFVVLNIMEQRNMTNGNQFHFIGHSYGSFVVNEASKRIMEMNPTKKIRRLTLLDPAVAPYRYNHQRRFDPESADFIDAIHGDGGNCFPTNFGIFTPVGHLDFYPNGGGFQISCYPYAIESILHGDILYGAFSLLYPPLCSHLQAIQYFKVSINHPQGLYIGAECKSYKDFILGDCHRCCKEDFSKCAVMGMDSEKYFNRSYDPYTNRKYYLNLGLECPYNEDYAFSIYRDC